MRMDDILNDMHICIKLNRANPEEKKLKDWN